MNTNHNICSHCLSDQFEKQQRRQPEGNKKKKKIKKKKEWKWWRRNILRCCYIDAVDVVGTHSNYKSSNQPALMTTIDFYAKRKRKKRNERMKQRLIMNQLQSNYMTYDMRFVHSICCCCCCCCYCLFKFLFCSVFFFFDFVRPFVCILQRYKHRFTREFLTIKIPGL